MMSLGAVPEEEFETYNSVAPEPVGGEGIHNSGYVEYEETNADLKNKADGKVQRNIVDCAEDVQHHTIIDSEGEKDSGVQDSDSGMTTDSEWTEHTDKAMPTSEVAQPPIPENRGQEVVSIDFD